MSDRMSEKQGSLKDRFYSLSKKYDFRYTPVLDQYFTIDTGVIQRAVKYANLTQEDIVLEVGPGMGFLTEEIAKSAGKVITVEKDKRFELLLKETLEEHQNIEYIFNDFLNTNLPNFNKVVANIPYSISAPLTFKLLENDFELAVLFFQKEFAEKMCGKPGTANYGRLTVMVQYYADVEMKEVVPRNTFWPQPKTDAAIVVIKPKKIPQDFKFNNFVRDIFRYRNKDVRNAVKTAFGKDIEDNRKMHTLSVQDVHDLYEKLKQ
jgi:16S rRNA (adenine1518-N6/adenine1519-N6)-dimethyltransferase